MSVKVSGGNINFKQQTKQADQLAERFIKQVNCPSKDGKELIQVMKCLRLIHILEAASR